MCAGSGDVAHGETERLTAGHIVHAYVIHPCLTGSGRIRIADSEFGCIAADAIQVFLERELTVSCLVRERLNRCERHTVGRYIAQLHRAVTIAVVERDKQVIETRVKLRQNKYLLIHTVELDAVALITETFAFFVCVRIVADLREFGCRYTAPVERHFACCLCFEIIEVRNALYAGGDEEQRCSPVVFCLCRASR